MGAVNEKKLQKKNKECLNVTAIIAKQVKDVRHMTPAWSLRLPSLTSLRRNEALGRRPSRAASSDLAAAGGGACLPAASPVLRPHLLIHSALPAPGIGGFRLRCHVMLPLCC